MSAPYVTGAAALIWSEFEGLNNDQVKQRILSGVDALPEQSKKTLDQRAPEPFQLDGKGHDAAGDRFGPVALWRTPDQDPSLLDCNR